MWETIQSGIGHGGALSLSFLHGFFAAQPCHPWANLNDIAIRSRRTATICTLVLAAFRRLFKARGGVCTPGAWRTQIGRLVV